MRHHRTLRLSIFLVLILALSMTVVGQETSRPIWAVADDIRGQVFQAQRELFVARRSSEPTEHYNLSGQQVEAAIEQYEAFFRPAIRPELAAVDQQVLDAFTIAREAAHQGAGVSLAAAWGNAWTNLLNLSYQMTLDAVQVGDLDAAQAWLRLREYRQATKVSLVRSPAVTALEDLRAGTVTSDDALVIVGDDLRDAYFFRFREALNELEGAIRNAYVVRAAEWVGQAQGYFGLLQADFIEKQGQEQAALINHQLDTMLDLALAESLDAISLVITEVRDAIVGYQPAVLDQAGIASRGQLLYIFTDLVYIEYKDGVRNGAITIPVEYQEALTFREQAEILSQELYPVIAGNNVAEAERIAALLSEMEAIMIDLGDSAKVRELVDEAKELIGRNLPFDITNSTAATFSIVDTLLTDIQNSITDGRYVDAEQTRLQAYALFDFGPEQRLLAFNPELAFRIDALFWHGNGDEDGLARVIATNVGEERLNAVLANLRSALEEAQLVLGTGVSEPVTIITNAAIIVFREGLEAVVIIVALTAGFAGSHIAFRRPLFFGAFLALLATVVTWMIADIVINLFRDYGERLEAVISLIALGVLLLITNWFFHRIYWTDHLAEQHKKKSTILRGSGGQFIGLMVLGFTSIYREGFETVLFLQALVIDAGLVTVLQGVALGLVLVAGVGFITFRLQRRLPYMKMMVVTGILIGVVLLVMVGNTVRVMQVVGWLPVTPIEGVSFSYWWGQWLGVYPTWEGIFSQVGAAVFVIGSYYLATWLSQRRRLKRASSPEQQSFHRQQVP